MFFSHVFIACPCRVLVCFVQADEKEIQNLQREVAQAESKLANQDAQVMGKQWEEIEIGQ